MQVKILKTLLMSETSPFSTNSLYWTQDVKSQRKTWSNNYKHWRKLLRKKLPTGFLPSNMKNYGLGIEVGIREEFDIDNTLKSLIDALQEKYGFNDSEINYLYAKKFITTKKGDHHDGSRDFIKIHLLEKVSLKQTSDATVIELEPDNDSREMAALQGGYY